MKELVTTALFSNPPASILAQPNNLKPNAEPTTTLKSHSRKQSLSAATVTTEDDSTILIQSCKSVEEIIRQRLLRREAVEDDADDAFFVADLGEVVRQYNQWTGLLPRIEPFFAMKCNPDPMVVKLMSTLKTGFDCASKVGLLFYII